MIDGFNINSSKINSSRINSSKVNSSRINSFKITICPTPIGNLGDMTERMRSALICADVVFCEDTRVTGKLLSHVGSHAKTVRLDENLMGKRASEVVESACQGKHVVYCSDAGMPGISDPGQRLVQTARAAGIDVEVLPGPCAVINAYVASGFEADGFTFMGFFPRKAGERQAVLSKLQNAVFVSVFYESPARILSALSAISEVLPDRQICVCRELTKIHEEVVVGKALEVYESFSQRDGVRGEIALVIDCADKKEIEQQNSQKNGDAKKLSYALASQELKSGQIAKILQNMYDISKNDAYRLSLDAKNNHNEQKTIMNKKL